MGDSGIPSTSLTSNEIDRIPNSWTLHQVDVDSPGLPRLSSPGWNRSPCPPAFGHHTSAQRALDPLEHLSCKSKSAKSATTSITSFQKKNTSFQKYGPHPTQQKNISQNDVKRCGTPMVLPKIGLKIGPKNADPENVLRSDPALDLLHAVAGLHWDLHQGP